MAKNVVKKVKLQLHAGKATPAPPVGTALGPTGINMQQFCTEFNDKTRDRGDLIIPVVVSIYDDRTFTLEYKTPPASVLIIKMLGIEKGSGTPNKIKVGKLTWEQCKEIAEAKMPDLNANDVENGARIIAGTARNMGVDVTGMPA